MIIDRDAVLIGRAAAQPATSESSLVAHSAGAFARALGQLTSRARAAGGTDLYRVVLPTGAVAKDLVPAIGGGFRGLVRSSSSSAIAGQVRLIPATAAAGAGIAAGPLIATIGLAVASEMLSQYQMSKKLDSMSAILSDLQQRRDAQERAVLVTADQEARRVAGYLLDQANLPHIAHANHAFGELAQLANQRIDALDHWRGVVADHASADHVSSGRLLVDLIGKREVPVERFERAVIDTYETLALRSRIVVLEKIASEFSNPGRSLPHVEHALRSELSGLAERQEQLRTLLQDLNAVSMDGGRLPNPVAINKAFAARSSLGRLAKALHHAPPALPMLTDSDQTILDFAPSRGGLVAVTPTES